jgi:hypothetical protein
MTGFVDREEISPCFRAETSFQTCMEGFLCFFLQNEPRLITEGLCDVSEELILQAFPIHGCAYGIEVVVSRNVRIPPAKEYTLSNPVFSTRIMEY